ncbi:MAG TPA: prolyl oligopeptidase family serine peptidase [Steroidobacteraceae bacterium]|nr:prolyl oligopeptidase family serine peptidase [Steroidobacteraceae bacterium]
MNKVATGLLAASLALGSAIPAAERPPATRTVPEVDRLFGLTLPDPYRWMEGAQNPEFAAWLSLQGQYTRRQLDALPSLQSWRVRLKAASGAATINRLQRRVAGRIFFLRTAGGRPGVLMVRDRQGAEHVLLDPNPPGSAASTATITEYSPSPDGTLIAVNVDHGGDEVTQVTLLDTATGAAQADLLERIWGELPVTWLPDGSGYTYTQMAPREDTAGGDPVTNMRVRVHRLGQPVQDDPIILASGGSARLPLLPQEFPFIDASADSDQAAAIAGGARQEERICIAPKSMALSAEAPWQCIVDYADQVQAYDLHGSTLYLLSMKGAPNGRILALDLSRKPATLSQARVLVPEALDTVLTGLASAHDALYVRQMKVGVDSFVRLPHGGDAPEAIAMPFAGAAFLMSARPTEDGLLFTLQGWTTPRIAYAFDPLTGKLTDLKLGASSPGDYSGIVATETVARSADGTEVPLTIIARSDAARDRSHLAIVDGYGGYGISQQPYFDPLNLEWVKAGHVYAIAHVRGGGEKGNAWWLAGKPPHKERGVEDFIACAGQLVKMGLTTPLRTAASGASAGGALVGGAITRAPGDFGAAVIHAGMLNPVRLLAGANGANQIAEFGDPRTAPGLKALAAMDPYQRVHKGVRYPAVLLAVGLNDSRVPTWGSGKFGARLRAASASGKPIWFRTNGDAGHFNDSLDDTAAERADVAAFLEQVLH